jgi:hypothetical protein
MLGAIKVELAGTDIGWLEILLAIIGPVLIAGAAVFAAITARRSAIERQEKQLEHDTQRQEEALAHDLERQKLALAHDREMRNRESTRIVLDNAMEAADSIIKKFTDLESAVRHLQKTMDEKGRGDPHLLEIAEERRRRCTAGINELLVHSLRLRTRPDLDDLTSVYQEVRENYSEHASALERGISSRLTDAQWSEIKAIDTRGTDKIAKLLTKWREWLGD